MVLLTFIRGICDRIVGIVSSCCGANYVRFNSGRGVIVGKGEGAFSFVYHAYIPSDNKKYALKKVFIQSTEFEKSVTAEIESFERFHHSNILPMIDYTYDNSKGHSKIVYMLFQLCQNGSLRHQLNLKMKSKSGDTKFPIEQVLSQFRDICQALNVLHTFSPSYVHQDIKPENILMSNDNRPLLTDFGSVRKAEVIVDSRAKVLAVAEEASQFCTISYRSPELFDPPKGITLDSRTDVWSLGCLLFAWYYGYSPFECEFNESGNVIVVECSHLRVLSKTPMPIKPSRNDMLLASIVDWILQKEISIRPFTSDIIIRLDELIMNYQNGCV